VEGGAARTTPYYYGDLSSQDITEGRMSPRLDEMSRRHLYETAFDSKVTKSDDDLDVDVVTNKSILVTERKNRGLNRQEPVQKRPKSLIRPTVPDRRDTLSEGLSQLDLGEGAGIPPFRAPTPPSSAPLPTKFHSAHCIATVHSAPDIPVRAKDLKLPIKSSKHRSQDRPRSCLMDKLDKCPPRPRSLFCGPRKAEDGPRGFGEILEIKGRPPRRPKYSSTESMATSSSGGSLESIRSSTSEGNRSTSSCESRRSSSLSSHSSDSTGSGPGYHPMVHPLNTRVFQQTQLHILSPISDKSSQEPGSETSENNKNNNSQRGSPEELNSPMVAEGQKKRRTPQNRNIINLGLCFDQEAHQGSDSGISIESRVGKPSQIDFSDLPFDMPKLRRRRMLQDTNSVQDTSGSATSVDLRDLPFDMPKLRRRLRTSAPSNNSSVSQASSSNSFQESTNCKFHLQL
jgi:hypothetical protein